MTDLLGIFLSENKEVELQKYLEDYASDIYENGNHEIAWYGGEVDGSLFVDLTLGVQEDLTTVFFEIKTNGLEFEYTHSEFEKAFDFYKEIVEKIQKDTKGELY